VQFLPQNAPETVGDWAGKVGNEGKMKGGGGNGESPKGGRDGHCVYPKQKSGCATVWTSSCWGDRYQKILRLRRFKSDRDEIRRDCSSREFETH